VLYYGYLFGETHLNCEVIFKVNVFLAPETLAAICYPETFSCKLFVVNVSLNPGSVKYPCTVCTLAIKSYQRALLCDSCNL